MMERLKCSLFGHEERHRTVEMLKWDGDIDEKGMPIYVSAPPEERIDCERCGAFYVHGRWHRR